jgi:hypothetical protein
VNPDEKDIDRDIEDVMAEEKSRGRKQPLDPSRKKKMRRLAAAALRAIQARDARAFTEELKRAGVREGSSDWQRAWKAFHDAS